MKSSNANAFQTSPFLSDCLVRSRDAMLDESRILRAFKAKAVLPDTRYLILRSTITSSDATYKRSLNSFELDQVLFSATHLKLTVSAEKD